MSNRASAAPTQPRAYAPVWNATWVSRTSRAATPRRPSSRGAAAPRGTVTSRSPCWPGAAGTTAHRGPPRSRRHPARVVRGERPAAQGSTRRDAARTVRETMSSTSVRPAKAPLRLQLRRRRHRRAAVPRERGRGRPLGDHRPLRLSRRCGPATTGRSRVQSLDYGLALEFGVDEPLALRREPRPRQGRDAPPARPATPRLRPLPALERAARQRARRLLGDDRVARRAAAGALPAARSPTTRSPRWPMRSSGTTSVSAAGCRTTTPRRSAASTTSSSTATTWWSTRCASRRHDQRARAQHAARLHRSHPDVRPDHRRPDRALRLAGVR